MKAPHELSDDEWVVLHAMQDLDARGVYPSGGRVVDAVSLAPALARRIRRDLLAWGLARPATPDDGVDADPDSGDVAPPDGDESPEVKAWNVALFRVLEGEPGLVRNLSILTGMTADAIKSRVKRVRHTYKPGDFPEARDEWEPDEKRYFAKRYRKSSDPTVREWLAGVIAPHRARPDYRSADDSQCRGA
jgi:hypothetical protein